MRQQGCPIVGHMLGYWSRYDMFGCPDCDDWTEEPCSCRPEDKCPFTKPPKKPSLSKDKPEIFHTNVRKPR